MSTKCGIALELKDKSVLAVYCHFDGYPEGVGAALYRYWNSYKKAEEVLSYEKIRAIEGRKIEAFKNPEQSITRFRNRSNYQRNVWREFVANYAYLFVKNEWWIASSKRDYKGQWFLLEDILREDQFEDF